MNECRWSDGLYISFDICWVTYPYLYDPSSELHPNGVRTVSHDWKKVQGSNDVS